MREEPPRQDRPRILILGGTTEAFLVAAQLAHSKDIVTISSLAGRVGQPRIPEGIVRVGGFGGLSGLTRYLIDERIGVVIDATHPFAAKISGAAENACNSLGIPLIAYDRLPWEPMEHDLWCTVPDAQAAADLVDKKGNRVFLSIGRQELGTFSACADAWFLIRAIDSPEEELPLQSKLVLDRGPFLFGNELQLFRRESIRCVVSKNSGGIATYPKIEAARAMRIPVVMIERPAKHKISTVTQLDDVLRLLASIVGFKLD